MVKEDRVCLHLMGLGWELQQSLLTINKVVDEYAGEEEWYIITPVSSGIEMCIGRLLGLADVIAVADIDDYSSLMYDLYNDFIMLKRFSKREAKRLLKNMKLLVKIMKEELPYANDEELIW